MSDLSDTIKGFYSDFILRDLLSYITPGAIVIGTIAFGLNLGIGKRDSIFIWIILFGIFYIVGLGLQCIREQIPWLKFPPITYQNSFRDSKGEIIPDEKGNSDEKNKNSPYKVEFGCDEKSRNAKYYQNFRLRFIKTIHDKEIESKVHERFIVTMQASGNSAIASLFAGFIGLFFCWVKNFQQIQWTIYTIICFLLCIILYINFTYHRQRLLDWELETIKIYNP